jgi:hypothetical protein
MSSSQVNYPERIILKGRGINLSRNLKKGPNKEIVLLDSHRIQLKRNEHALQPILTTGLSAKIESLVLRIPLSEKWVPLIHNSYRQTYTSLFLNNSNKSTVLQICQNPKNSGLVRISLTPGGRSVTISWIIDRSMETQEELTLPTVHFSQNDNKITPMRYSFKERKAPPLNRGRLLTFSGNPAAQRVSKDIEETKKQGLSFDFYLLDYGTAPLWGDWMNLSTGIVDKMALMADEIRRKGMIPGICLAPLTAEKRSNAAQSSLTLGKGTSRSIKVGGKKKHIMPLDITREEVRNTLRKTLDLYIQWGFKFFHFDHLDLILEEGSWQDETIGPLDRFRLLTRIMEPYRERGIIFSASSLPLMAGMEYFDVITPSMMEKNCHLTQREWQSFSLILELAMNVKNPPLLSLGGLTFSNEKKKVLCRHEKIYHNSQALLNGPAILAEDYELIDEITASQWKELAIDKRAPLLPLEYSSLGFSQNVLLLINRKKNVAIFNLSRKKKVVHLLEGELGDSRGLSPSQSTALKSSELILPMGAESSHLFQV